MRYWLRLAGIVCLVLISLPGAFAQSPEVLETDKKIIAFAQENSQIMDNLEYLCDVIGPRLTGTERLRRAKDWAASKMGGDGLGNVHLEGYTIPIGWERVTCRAG